MSTNFTGVTFPNQKVTPAYDAVIRRALLDDGILTGCALTYSGSTLTMAAGQLMLCGRQIIHPSSQNWAVTEATTGYARLVLTIDLTRTSTKDTFDQVVDEIQYATAADGFTALEQSDINATGSKYQVAVCVVSLGPGGITGIISQLDATEGGGAGGILTVTAPAGVAVTVSKDDKSKSKMSGVSGIAVFKGLASGTWTVTITDGTQTATKPVVITADYSTIMAFFAATINITYPAGSTCTATDGTTTLTAPDTTGTWACVVPNAGTWTISDNSHPYDDTVEITDDGQSETVDITRLWLYRDGDVFERRTGGFGKAISSSGDSFNNSDGQMVVTVKQKSSGGGATTIATEGLIDLSGISVIKFNMLVGERNNSPSTYPDDYSAVGLVLSDANAVKARAYTNVKGQYETVSVEVGSIPGQNKVGASVVGGYNAGNTLKIKEIWGEV